MSNGRRGLAARGLPTRVTILKNTFARRAVTTTAALLTDGLTRRFLPERGGFHENKIHIIIMRIHKWSMAARRGFEPRATARADRVPAPSLNPAPSRVGDEEIITKCT